MCASISLKTAYLRRVPILHLWKSILVPDVYTVFIWMAWHSKAWESSAQKQCANVESIDYSVANSIRHD